MKYFFLSDSWTTGRVWEFGGLWNEAAWMRKPHLEKKSLCIKENGETLHLYEAEASILMVEVMPKSTAQKRLPIHEQTAGQETIGQVVLKRLLGPEQVIERLCQEEVIFQSHSSMTFTGIHADNLPSENEHHFQKAPDVAATNAEPVAINQSGMVILDTPAIAARKGPDC